MLHGYVFVSGNWIVFIIIYNIVGVDAVNWLAQHLRVSKKDAEKFGQILLTRHYIHHICYKHHFEDKYIFFRFTVMHAFQNMHSRRVKYRHSN